MITSVRVNFLVFSFSARSLLETEFCDVELFKKVSTLTNHKLDFISEKRFQYKRGGVAIEMWPWNFDLST